MGQLTERSEGSETRRAVLQLVLDKKVVMIIRVTGEQWRHRMGDEFFSKISALPGVPVVLLLIKLCK